MSNFLKTANNSFYSNFLIKLVASLIISLGIGSSAVAQDTVGQTEQAELSTQEEIRLNQGQVLFKGKKGKYTVQVMATGTMDTAWQVLTDYDNFRDFLPNVSDSKIVVDDGDRKIFEQTNIVDLWFFAEEFTVQIESSEVKPQKISFKLYEGDLKHLSGTWQATKMGENKVMITHTVDVEPQSTTEKAFFYGIYENTLEKTLAAISSEVTKRSTISGSRISN